MYTRSLATAAAVVAWLFLLALPAVAAPEVLLAHDGSEHDHFGWSVAVDGDVAVVGAPQDDEGGEDSGAAYVYLLADGTWTYRAKLLDPEPFDGARFGYSVAVSGDSIVVGSYPTTASTGTVIVYRATGLDWDLEQRLQPAEDVSGSQFGCAVAADGDSVVIGAPQARTDGVAAGAAYVFVRSGSGWTEEQRLVAAQPIGYTKLGRAVDIDGDRVIAGTANRSAHVFHRQDGAWIAEARLSNDGVDADHDYGRAVGISGRTAVIGSPQDDDMGSYSGAIYVHTLGDLGWVPAQKLTASDGTYGENLGWSVAISGQVILGGALRADLPNAWDGGAVYRYVRRADRWDETEKIATPTASGGDQFGAAVAMNGNVALAGAHLDNDMGLDSGTAWTFPVDQELLPVDPDNDPYFGDSVDLTCDTAVLGSFGHATVLRRVGSQWTEEQRLDSVPGSDDVLFGGSVAVAGDVVVVGASSDEEFGAEGSATVFVRSGDTWTRDVRLTAWDTAAPNGFGRDVAISTDTLVVGAFQDGGRRGAAYVFRRTGGVWQAEQKLVASWDDDGAMLGHSVAVHGDTIVSSAPGYDGPGTNVGAAVVFVRVDGVWVEQDTLTAPNLPDYAHLGSSCDLFGDRVVLGRSGFVSVFERIGDRWVLSSGLSPADQADETGFGADVAISANTIVVASTWTAGEGWVFTYNGVSWSQQRKLIPVDRQGMLGPGAVAVHGNDVLMRAIRSDGQGSGIGGVLEYEPVGAPVPSLMAAPVAIPESTTGVPFALTVETSGGLEPPFVWSVVGDFPISGGVDPQTGRIDGAYGAPGDYAFTLRVEDACGHVAEQMTTTRVNARPQILTTALPAAAEGRPYTAQVAAEGGTGTLAYRLLSGSLPGGLSFDGTTGALLGTPMSTQTYTLRCDVIDGAGAVSDAQSMPVHVMPVADLIDTSLRTDVSLGTSPHTTALELVRGTRLSVKVSYPKGSRQAATLALDGPDGAPVPLSDRLRLKKRYLTLKSLEVPYTGRYVLVVDPADGFRGTVRVKVKVVAPTRSVQSTTVARGDTQTVHVGALPGAAVKIQVKPARRSNALPAILAVLDEDGRNLLVPEDLAVKDATQTLKIADAACGGTLRIIVGTRDGTAGEIQVTTRVKEPRGYDYSRPEDPCMYAE